MKARRMLITIAAVAALGGLFAFGLLRGEPDRNLPSELIGKAAPSFDLQLYERYQGTYGEVLSLSDYLGEQPLVVNFWASWCAPCYVEAPVLQSYWQEYEDTDVLFVGVQTQDRGKYDEGRDFLDQFGLSFPNAMDDDSRMSIGWGLLGVPETFFVNREGRVVHKHIGPVTPEVMETQLAALLE